MMELYPEVVMVNDTPRSYYVSIYNYPLIFSIRDLKTSRVGYLIAVQGTITRTTQTRPELELASFKCLECGTIVPHIPQQFKYTQPTICPMERCGNKTSFLVLPEESRFNDWQQIRMQENSSDIPAGSMPRTLSIILRNDLVEVVKPGDKVVVTGTLVVVPDVYSTVKGGVTSVQERGRLDHGDGVIGLHELGVRDLCYRLCVVASHIRKCNEDTVQEGEQRYT
uniref:DNA replication licensing factor MCM6 n=2 Tax=Lygus hesperus TaxID=30085 RepID=A0A146L6Q0_LYGHE